MGVRFQVVIDCAEPEPLARFWAAALGYVLEPPPERIAVLDNCFRHIGLPGVVPRARHGLHDRPRGQRAVLLVPDRSDVKTVKNRLRLDVHASGGRAVPLATRRERVDAEARRLASLGATILSPLGEEDDDGADAYAVAMKDPRATSSTSTDNPVASALRWATLAPG